MVVTSVTLSRVDSTYFISYIQCLIKKSCCLFLYDAHSETVFAVFLSCLCSFDLIEIMGILEENDIVPHGEAYFIILHRYYFYIEKTKIQFIDDILTLLTLLWHVFNFRSQVTLGEMLMFYVSSRLCTISSCL